MKILRTIGTVLMVLGILLLIVTARAFVMDIHDGLFMFTGGQIVIMVGCIIAIVVGGVLRKQGNGKK